VISEWFDIECENEESIVPERITGIKGRSEPRESEVETVDVSLGLNVVSVFVRTGKGRISSLSFEVFSVIIVGEAGEFREYDESFLKGLESGNGDASDTPFLEFLSLPGRALGWTMLTTAFPAFLYSFNASSPKPRNAKKMMEDTDMAHQDSKARLRNCGPTDVQT